MGSDLSLRTIHMFDCIRNIIQHNRFVNEIKNVEPKMACDEVNQIGTGSKAVR